MKRYSLYLALSLIFVNMSIFALSNTESEHFPAEIWQRKDGKLCVRLLDLEWSDRVIVFDQYTIEKLSNLSYVNR